MKKSVFLSIVIALSLISCNNSKKSSSTTEVSKIIQEIKPSTNLTADSLRGYKPDDRERQFIYADIFDIPEPYIEKSPAESHELELNKSESVIAYDVCPAELIVAAVIKDPAKYQIKLWKIDTDGSSEAIEIPDSLNPNSIVWHPQGKVFFISGEKGRKHSIIRYEKKGFSWSVEEIYSSKFKINRVIICPRPFEFSYDDKLGKSLYAYRLFFGLQKDDSSYRIVSITEFGKKFYQVIGPSSTFSHAEYVDPSQIQSNWAIPVAFHPSGQNLIWENSNGVYYTAKYSTNTWDETVTVLKAPVKEGQISIIPNGLGLLYWQRGKPGLNLYFFANSNEMELLQSKKFVESPVFTPDGRGIVSVLEKGNLQYLEYVTIDYPLSDVINSWMFAESNEDINLLDKNVGLFRTSNDDQLYQIYESENYYCNGYDQSTPTRPYLITTDIFWELFGSAFQGIFTLKERADAIPSFWKFVHSANSFYEGKSINSQWPKVFKTLINLEKNDSSSTEVLNIKHSQAKLYSEVRRDYYEFSQLKPLGIYTSNSQMELYYRAFKYLTTIFENNKSVVSQLNDLPSEIKESALDWINSYREFISKPRRENVFSGKFTIPKYVQYPDTGLSVFPLSWGFDNEILNSLVYHESYPKDKQIISKNGDMRLHPSGLDLAASISSDFANSLLDSEYQEYPKLRTIIQGLRNNFDKNSVSPENTLYDLWINALSEQWIDTLKSTIRNRGDSIWQVKRLQTGLASWATLRHATVLVNETGAAECGEAGFEPILMRAPRGYVEPDPYTLEAIAKLFESLLNYVTRLNESLNENTSAFTGIANNLKETADEIRSFKKIAEKEIHGEALSNHDYEAILYIARIAEHKFLLFKSLANTDYALSKPDPLPKITNVFGNLKTGYLMSAVGRPIEWDFTVPFFGRKQIVKGSVYSYYEFVSSSLINDSEWLSRLPSQEFLPWIKPYVSKQKLSYPPACGM